MRRFLKHTTLLVVAIFALYSCFKETVGYTRYNLAIYVQADADEAFSPAKDVDSYAFAVDTTEWYIASWEDAVAHRITNKTTGETIEEPSAYGEFNSSQEYQATILVNKPISMLVVVNPELKLYAYRNYELPVNLPDIYAKLYMAAWRPTHNSSGWTIVNRFYAEPSDEDKNEGDEGDEGNEGGDENEPTVKPVTE